MRVDYEISFYVWNWREMGDFSPTGRHTLQPKPDSQHTKNRKLFNVSSDFLLCLTNVPNKNNYDISKLGLSAEAARNLHTGQVKSEVVSRLLKNRRFAQLTNMIALYFDETMVSGFAAQNQILQTLSPCC